MMSLGSISLHKATLECVLACLLRHQPPRLHRSIWHVRCQRAACPPLLSCLRSSNICCSTCCELAGRCAGPKRRGARP